MPIRDADRTVVVYHASPERSDRGTSFPAYQRYRSRTDLFADVMAFTAARPLMLIDGDRPARGGAAAGREQIYAEPVTASFFSLADIGIRLGRPFDRDIDGSIAPHFVAVLSHAFWERRLASDPDVVGKTLLINDRRDFTHADTSSSSLVAIANETMARTFWPQGHALGAEVQRPDGFEGHNEKEERNRRGDRIR